MTYPHVIFWAKNSLFFLFLFTLHVPVANAAAGAASVSDEHIRQIVAELLKKKDQTIAQLEARLQQLEHTPTAENTPAETGTAPDAQSGYAIVNKLGDLTEEVEALKEAAKEKGLNISGFFDVNAKT
ncbi:MAG: hypothetical protein Q8L79_06600 [Methylobacter sp.]|uniref:hypothetical protein n=1 Tax=Methylobacter sp. TaxID=2051955 RepID=UPI002731255A|nr:hypothetical protein [Methylobacter sp.]MDP1664784.1 hypothetical protein [Methylobacter sp.]